MGRYGKLGKNVAFITIGNFASKLLSFVMVPFYTSILTTEEFGIADLMSTTVNLILPFLTLLISEALLRFALDADRSREAVFTTALAVLLVGTSIFLLLSPVALIFQQMRTYYLLFLLYYAVTALHTVLSYFARGIEQVFVYSVSGVLHTFVSLGLNILFLAVIKTGVYGYLWSMIIGGFVTCAYLFFGAKLYRYIRPHAFDKGLLRDMLNYSVPMIPNSLSWWISNSSDKYILSFFCGVSLTGIYSVSQRIPSLFATISTIFMGAWQISAVEDFGTEENRRFFSEVYCCYSSFCILVVSVLICSSKWLASLLFAKDFFDGWRYVPILLLAFLFHGMAGLIGSIYTSSKQTKMLFFSTLLAALLNICLNFAMIPFWGAYGAAIATLISYAAIWLVRIIHSRRILPLKWNVWADMISYLLLILQTLLLLWDRGWITVLLSCGLLLVLLAIHAREVLRIVKRLVSGRRGARNA